jgi:ParB/RepB/Spo0J family partition protein
MRISEIRTGERHRKDLGDIAGLAASIAEIGLLHPIVVTPDGTLIAGARRIAACAALGWTDIPVTVVDIPAIVRGEYAENTCRKGFAPSEAVAIWQAMESHQGQLRHHCVPGERRIDRAANALATSTATLTRAKTVVDAAEAEPEKYAGIVEQMDRTGNVDGAVKEKRKRDVRAERAILVEKAQGRRPCDRWHIDVADVRTYATEQRFDFIITDPPYPREYLDLYRVLAERALEWLKPGGLLLAMCGQSYFDQIMLAMGKRLEYYWMASYQTPGQPTPLRQRQVNTSWKPILIYGLPGESYKGKIFGDVWVSGGNDKDHHKWGQSVSGMLSLVKQVCLPGQSVFDPFCGAGTTGIAALMHGCTFWGIDIDEKSADLACGRLAEVNNDQTA